MKVEIGIGMNDRPNNETPATGRRHAMLVKDVTRKVREPTNQPQALAICELPSLAFIKKKL